MERRSAIKNVLAIFGGAMTMSTLAVLEQGCQPVKDNETVGFGEESIRLLTETGDIILPDTEGVPGAGACEVGNIIVKMLNDCYSQADQEEVLSFISYVRDKEQMMDLTRSEREQLIGKIDAEVYGETKNTPSFSAKGYKLIKELTVFGYFSSEIGLTKALDYHMIPGRFDGCIDYHEGDKAQA
ncbi:gluconate 2-dehydrogenase subunit 3 family protein [Echinicola strongylocentroti]|uniref:Gluconate 2-dehydrogenase subunit 3 family protein n=1 Tax=Echinicola strongylocentroti TaxID=1795355 RepID=A0A2Z4IPQ7_9BACT|nr:gluconate 2-dehydrogenase subunit 3 family protein [Echinicola strongylocentroti]AWW32750.1 gluconate 2-dehydrogenase subunit 3 family protein [Echinicola strongylocentroti]